MTVKLPEANFFDRILKFFGKSRGVMIPPDIQNKYGRYVYARAKRENFWKALFRPKGKELPKGFVDINSLSEQNSNQAEHGF